MTLVVAMRVLAGTQTGDRNAAAECLHAKLRALAREVRPGAAAVSWRDDAVQEALWRFLSRLESRGELDAPHEGAVARYLRRILSNLNVDEIRRRKRETPLEEVAEPSAPKTSPSEPSRAIEEAAALASRVCDATCARWPRAAETLRSSYRELVSLAERSTTVEALLRGVAPDDFRRERNNLYRRHERCRARLIEQARALETAGELTTYETRLAIGFIGWLRR